MIYDVSVTALLRHVLLQIVGWALPTYYGIIFMLFWRVQIPILLEYTKTFSNVKRVTEISVAPAGYAEVVALGHPNLLVQSGQSTG